MTKKQNLSTDWDYDHTGNWTKYSRITGIENRTHNAANEIQGIADHDQNGNMTVMPGMKAKYDAWDRLVEVKDSSDALLANYEYNGLNHRVKKTVGDVVTMSFFNAQWQELDSATVFPSGEGELTTYIWGTRYIDDLVLCEKAGEPFYSLADPNWNVVAVTDDSGTVQERMKYDAFGKVTWMGAGFATKAASDLAWNRTFTGQVLDSETGLMLYRNRYYHTGFGRFVTRDPIGYEAEDVSLYRYVSNAPIYFIDSQGFTMGRGEQYFPPPPPSRPKPLPLPNNQPPTPPGDPCIPPPENTDPCWTPPETRDRDFSYDCREAARGVSAIQDVVSMLGADHCYVRMGGLNPNGTPKRNGNNRGTTGIGIAGGKSGKAGNYPNNPEGKGGGGFKPSTTKPLGVRPGATLGHGSGKDKPASDATDCEIWDCVKNYPFQKDFNANPLSFGGFYVCWTWAKEAYEACGLTVK